MQVRYWAAIRAAAQCADEWVPAGSLALVLSEIRGRHAHSSQFVPVLAICSVLVDEMPVGARPHDDVDVAPGSTVDLLPPFAGG